MAFKDDKEIILYTLGLIKKRPGMYYDGHHIYELHIYVLGVIYGLMMSRKEKEESLEFFQNSINTFRDNFKKKYSIYFEKSIFISGQIEELTAEEYITLFEESIEEINII